MRSETALLLQFRPMFKRIRQLNISLAAKCQLLFGTAVVMIISAALFVPWQRIEQLTDQLNERAASALADEAVNWHIAHYSEERFRRSTTAPSTAPAAPLEDGLPRAP